MPYFEDKKVLFIHIPKTGGTSLEKFFDSSYTQLLQHLPGSCIKSKEIMMRNNLVFKKYGHSPQHSTITEIKQTFPNIISQAEKTFCIVRNPYSRLISEVFFDYKRCNKPFPYNNNISEYLSIINNRCRQMINNYKLNKTAYDCHFRPQFEYITDEKGADIPDNIRVFKFEDGFHQIEEYLNLKTGSLGHDNKTIYKYDIQRLDFKDILESDVITMVNDIYRNDFAIFKYEMI